MSDTVKMNLTNGIALLIYAMVAGIAYGSMQIAQQNVTVRVTNNEKRIKDLEDSDHKAELERVAYAKDQQMILSEIREIKDFMKSYNYEEAKNGN